ncbi:hypothetical protein ABT297_27460 [Dactylosporangium sp. NPDC000555]|uniref:hypothetical protein n=1 Tax=Dactylosporangium sp. NPDC000555 TaxID=3154260 RepID=UPI00331CF901
MGFVDLPGLLRSGADGAGRRCWPAVLADGAVFVAAAVGLLLVERRVAAPMLPLRLFAGRTLTGATIVGLLINLGFYGELFAINYSALPAGLASCRRWAWSRSARPPPADSPLARAAPGQPC